MSKPKFPVTVQRGHTIVKIYKTPSNGCAQFTVAYYLGDKRQRRAFSDYGLALTDADTVANRVSSILYHASVLQAEDGAFGGGEVGLRGFPRIRLLAEEDVGAVELDVGHSPQLLAGEAVITARAAVVFAHLPQHCIKPTSPDRRGRQPAPIPLFLSGFLSLTTGMALSHSTPMQKKRSAVTTNEKFVQYYCADSNRMPLRPPENQRPSEHRSEADQSLW